MARESLINTVERHFLENKGRNPHATEEFSWLLSGITLATKIIAAYVQRAGLLEIMGATGRINVQGEEVQRLEAFRIPDWERQGPNWRVPRSSLAPILRFADLDAYILESEEGSKLDGFIQIGVAREDQPHYLRLMGRLQRGPKRDGKDVMGHILQPGCNQVAAGYVVYGSSTVLAYTAGEGVHMFTLDPSIGAYLLAQENIRMPKAGRIYSVNEAYRSSFPERIQRYLDWAKEAGSYTSRYIGSLVADFHRTLIRGGVFLYPGTKKAPEGKLRLLYEANPLAFVAEHWAKLEPKVRRTCGTSTSMTSPSLSWISISI